MRFKSIEDKGSKAVAPPVDEAGIAKIAQNLLVHIPGEASGFYLMAMGAVKHEVEGSEGAAQGYALLFGILSLVLLILVRWLASASRAVMVTSIIALLLWMAILDMGVLRLYHLGIPGAAGAMVAAFYSTAVTLLASAGKLK